ncbi:hypothetical protein [Bradyrhizobium sp. NAS96.2]|uniref:hypothetical protein n=1 Tax=Bradyrhizobium sp. NAS96.2 TaxID=1680160 RepID=UPI00093A02F3|nr:hypothetical protein [Bradyrhizobium sp. NAS96.2]OKO81365.1 hypothetical protein AC628_07065 [Bradyrhizobium sp. NAS96.2]
MEEFFRFIQQSGRERSRLVREAQATCDSVVLPLPRETPSNKGATAHTIGHAIAARDLGALS